VSGCYAVVPFSCFPNWFPPLTFLKFLCLSRSVSLFPLSFLIFVSLSGIGKYKNLSTQFCIKCPQGHYQSEVGQTSCPVCKPGLYASKSAMGSCLECVPGYSQKESSSFVCKPCPKDHFTNETSQAHCQECAIGTFSLPGSASCPVCAVGEAGKPCTKCAPGKYRGNLQAANKCVPCEKGFFSSEEGQSVRKRFSSFVLFV